MATQQSKPSTSWAISAGLSIGKSKEYFGGSAIFLTLFDVESQIYIPMNLVGASAGIGLSGGLTISTFSPYFFTTSKPLWAKDFDKMVNIVTAEFTVGIGSGLTYITFRGVDHNPYWLDIGGTEFGLSAGIGTSILYCHVNDKDGWKNDGCLIAPGGDPLCGGETKIGGESPAYQSTN